MILSRLPFQSSRTTRRKISSTSLENTSTRGRGEGKRKDQVLIDFIFHKYSLEVKKLMKLVEGLKLLQ
jgi:hypothetical protein